MKVISDLLLKYKNVKTPYTTVRKVFIEGVEKILDISIKEKDVRIQRHIISIKAPSVIKNEIRLNQKEILSYIKKELGESTVVNAIL